MKKHSVMSVSLLFLGLVISFVSPVKAGIVISCQDQGNGVFAVNYDATSEPGRIRSFDMDIWLSSGTIEVISDYKIGVSTAEDPGYGIFMGSIQISPDGTVIDYSNPVADPSIFPFDTMPGLGSGGITVGMASLYDRQEQNAPPKSGTLFKATVDWGNADFITVYMSDNVSRGGIIMEDGSQASPTYVGCTMTVPEPATILLLGFPAGILLRKRRKLKIFN